MTVVGYGRVSSRGQIDGNSLESQEKILRDNGCAEVYVEQYTGKTTDRPVLKQVVENLKPGDTLMVTKLDRLARNVTEGIQLVQKLLAKKVKVYILNVGLLEDTAVGRFFLTTLLAVAELERSFILERTAAGKEIARSKPGYKEGRPCTLKSDRVQAALDLLDSYSYNKVAELTGISKSTLIRARRLRRTEKISKELEQAMPNGNISTDSLV